MMETNKIPEELQNLLTQVMEEQNSRPITQFEGYSPLEMFHILNRLFKENSPVLLQKLDKEDCIKSPLYILMKSLAEIIRREGKVKLTLNGYLPPRFVLELYNQGHIREDNIDKGYIKLKRENDSDSISLAHFMLVTSGICTKRNAALTISKKGAKLLQNDTELFEHLFLFFINRFKWASNDGFGMEEIGQFGFGFSLILVNKYANQRNTDKFYALKYLNAFPKLLEHYIEPAIGTLKGFAISAYCFRTFDRFLSYWGLVDIEKVGTGLDTLEYITKQPLFNKLFLCMPPKNGERRLKRLL